MAVIPFDNRPVAWKAGRRGITGLFKPNGAISWYTTERDLTENPLRWEGGSETWTGRVIVGFARLNKPDVTLKDLIRVTRRMREHQTQDPSATFLLQKGIYRHKESGTVVEEDGAQVVIIDTHDTPPKKFEDQIVELAEAIARELEQEEVIVEIQKNGISQRVVGVGP